jgi:hypothetical protein
MPFQHSFDRGAGLRDGIVHWQLCLTGAASDAALIAGPIPVMRLPAHRQPFSMSAPRGIVFCWRSLSYKLLK